MKLRSDHLHRFYVETPDGDTDLAEVIKAALKEDGRSISRLQADCGLSHPVLACINLPRSKHKASIRTLLVALMELGYEINIEKSVAD